MPLSQSLSLERTVQLELPSVGICAAVRVSDAEAWLGLSSGEIQSFNLQTWKLGTAWRAHKRRVLALAVHEELVWSSSDETIIWEFKVRTLSPVCVCVCVWSVSVLSAVLTRLTQLRRPRKEIPNLKLTAMLSDGSVMWAFNTIDRTNYAVSVLKPADALQLQQLVHHRDVINAFCSIGPRVWSGSADGTICAWQQTDERRRREQSRADMRLSMYKAAPVRESTPHPMPSASTYAAPNAAPVSPHSAHTTLEASNTSSASGAQSDGDSDDAAADAANADEIYFPASWGVAPSEKRSPRIVAAMAASRSSPPVSLGNSYAQPPPLTSSSSSSNPSSSDLETPTHDERARFRRNTQVSLADLGGAYNTEQTSLPPPQPVTFAPPRTTKPVSETDTSYREPPAISPTVMRRTPPRGISSRQRSGSTSGTQLRSNVLLDSINVSPRAVDDEEVDRRNSKRSSSVGLANSSDGSPKPSRRTGLSRTNG